MTTTVYTLGYTGRKPHDIKALVTALDATLIDIRFSPLSRCAYWTKQAFVTLLGDRYQHLKALGNANYKSDGPVHLVDFAAGEAHIAASPRPVVLMCGCKDAHTCHRTHVAQLLRNHGYTVEEVGAHTLQPTLL